MADLTSPPLVAVWLDNTLYFSIGEGEQKASNLQTNQHVALTTGCNSWTEGLDVVVEGEAVAVTDHALLSRLAAAWADKWDGRWKYEARNGRFSHHPHGGEALVFAVRSSKVLAFGKGTFTHTTYRF